MIRSFQDTRKTITRHGGGFNSGWTAAGSVVTGSTLEAIVTGNGTIANPGIYSTLDSAPVIGRKYYIKARFKVTNAVCQSVGISYGGVLYTMQSSPTNGTTYDLSTVITATATTTDFYIRQVYTDAATANGKVLYAYDLVVIDLTTEYGSGSEPTAATMDKIKGLYALSSISSASFSVSDFDSMGDKVIQPRSCIEKKEDNGDWRIELEADISYLDWLANEYILVVATKANGNQPFRISKTTLGDAVVRVVARHIGFDLESHILDFAFGYSYTANVLSNTERTLRYALNGTQFFANGTAWTISKRVVFKGGNTYENLIECVGVYGGHLVFDWFNVQIAETIGADNGIVVEYGKNLQEAEAYEDWSEVCTTILPIGDNNLLIDPAPLATITIDATGVSYAKDYYRRVLFPGIDNVTDLTAAANAYLDIYKYPKVNYSVSTNVVQDVALGDTIVVKARQFEISTSVLAYTYDVLAGRLTDIEFGNFKRETKRIFSDIYADMDELKKSVVQENITMNETIGEGGTFTPTVRGSSTAGTGTYTTQKGYYTKVGNRVFYDIWLVWTAHTGSGNTRISFGDLPYTPNTDYQPGITILHSTYTLSANSWVQGYVEGSTGLIVISQNTTGGGTNSSLTLDSSATLIVSGSFVV